MRAKARQNLNQKNMAAHAYKLGELFRRLHPNNVQQSKENQAYSGIVSEEDPMESHTSAVNNFTLPSGLSIAQAAQGKRKASENKEQSTAPKKTKKNPKNKAWRADQVELLLRYATMSGNVTPGPRGCKFICKRGPFFDHGYAGYLTYLGSPTSM